MEECYRGLLDESLPERVNGLARELETIQQQFDLISGQFKIISYYQHTLPSSTGKTASYSCLISCLTIRVTTANVEFHFQIITKECATLGLDNETVIGCDQSFQDIGRVMSREESSLLQLHLINVGIGKATTYMLNEAPESTCR